MSTPIIDAWMQHPGEQFLANEMFDSLRRWKPGPFSESAQPFYIDTSAYTCARYPAELVDYLRGHGRRKVLFGSNHPFWPAVDCLAGFDALGLDERTARAFLHDNAAAVFGLKD